MAKEKPGELISIDEVKRWFRRALIRERQAVPASNRERWSNAAARHFLRSSYYRHARVVALFIGYGSEIITDKFIDRAWKDGKKVLLPITSRGFDRPFFALFQKGDKLERSKRGPFELVRKKAAFPFGSIDLVVVPGLAYDRDGFRLGYGGGVYDRILAKTPRAHHMGLFFSAQFMPVLPRANHDRKMTSILTEKGVQSPPCRS